MQTDTLKEEMLIDNPYESLRSQTKAKVWDYIVREKILPGSKIPSVREIGEAIGVSRATAGKAIVEMVNDGLLSSQPRKGVYVKSLVESTFSKLEVVYCLIESGSTLKGAAIDYLARNPFWSNILVGVRNSASRYEDLKLRVSFLEDFIAEENVTPRGRRWDNVGFIICGDPHRECWTQILSLNVPVVLINGVSRAKNVTTININCAKGVEMLVDHLVNLGHSCIGYCGPIEPQHKNSYQKYKGYISAITNHNLDIDYGKYVKNCNFGLEDGYNAVASLLRNKDKPTALLFVNDETAIGGMRAVCDAGLSIPKDISIAGFDNILSSNYTIPSLTTISSKMVEMGEMGVQKLFDAHKDRLAEPEIFTLKPELIVRESTGPLI
ncbi:MAG: GntR family transcriptional regulator [Sedimentisphaeraceae bacterium JB056]